MSRRFGENAINLRSTQEAIGNIVQNSLLHLPKLVLYYSQKGKTPDIKKDGVLSKGQSKRKACRPQTQQKLEKVRSFVGIEEEKLEGCV